MSTNLHPFLYSEALNKLQNDILKKTNGCAETGEPDRNNWCRGADPDESTDIGLSDVDELGYWWLAECPTDWPWQ